LRAVVPVALAGEAVNPLVSVVVVAGGIQTLVRIEISVAAAMVVLAMMATHLGDEVITLASSRQRRCFPC
jgi:hypothetical protein